MRFSDSFRPYLSQQSTFRCVPEAGHMLHHMVPDEVVAVIQDTARTALRGVPAAQSLNELESAKE